MIRRYSASQWCAGRRTRARAAESALQLPSTDRASPFPRASACIARRRTRAEPSSRRLQRGAATRQQPSINAADASSAADAALPPAACTMQREHDLRERHAGGAHHPLPLEEAFVSGAAAMSSPRRSSRLAKAAPSASPPRSESPAPAAARVARAPARRTRLRWRFFPSFAAPRAAPLVLAALASWLAFSLSLLPASWLPDSAALKLCCGGAPSAMAHAASSHALFVAWVAHRERSRLRAAAWIAAYLLLGSSIGGCVRMRARLAHTCTKLPRCALRLRSCAAACTSSARCGRRPATGCASGRALPRPLPRPGAWRRLRRRPRPRRRPPRRRRRRGAAARAAPRTSERVERRSRSDGDALRNNAVPIKTQSLAAPCRRRCIRRPRALGARFAFHSVVRNAGPLCDDSGARARRMWQSSSAHAPLPSSTAARPRGRCC